MPWNPAELTQTANRVLNMLRREVGETDANTGHLTMDNWEWPTGVALYGIWKTYVQTGDTSIWEYLTAWYDRMLNKPAPHRNVNTVAPMLALTYMYDREPNPVWLPHIESWAYWVHESMPRTEFGGLQHITVWNKHYQQLWADTLFMTALFLLKAGQTLGKPEWIEDAQYQFLVHIKYLQDRRTGLWTHGWTFDMRHAFAGAYWARGNAWFTAASVEILEALSQRGAAWRFISEALRDQALGLWKLQRESGMFTTLLDVEETYEETSATAGIAFGILKGVRLGFLSDTYEEMGRKAADAVMRKIAPDGTVMGVSGGTGMGHDLDHYKLIKQGPTAYGQGLTFLMLTEMLSWV